MLALLYWECHIKAIYMKVSIVTVCKNSASHIEKAIKSALEQKYVNRQYIIIDGQSNDNTLEIINEYNSGIDIIVSEPDAGIYNAMNKALTFVNGEVVYFLNSDDCFFDEDVLSDVAEEFKKDRQAMIVHGNVVFNSGSKNKVIRSDKISRRYFYKHTICHQALFVKKQLFDIIGGYDEGYPIHADTDWLMKAFLKYRVKFKYIDRTMSYYSAGGFSSSEIFAERYKYDRQEISAKYFLEAKCKLILKKILKRFGLMDR